MSEPQELSELPKWKAEIRLERMDGQPMTPEDLAMVHVCFLERMDGQPMTPEDLEKVHVCFDLMREISGVTITLSEKRRD